MSKKILKIKVYVSTLFVQTLLTLGFISLILIISNILGWEVEVNLFNGTLLIVCSMFLANWLLDYSGNSAKKYFQLKEED